MSIRPKISFAAALLVLLGWICIMLLCETNGDYHMFGPIEQCSIVDICFWAILIFIFAALIIKLVRMINNYYEICEDGFYIIRKNNSIFYPRQQIVIVCQKWMCYKLLYIVVKPQNGSTQMLKITYSKKDWHSVQFGVFTFKRILAFLPPRRIVRRGVCIL